MKGSTNGRLAGALLAASATASAGSAPPPAGLGCGDGETTYFACRTARGQTVRVCGDAGRGLQYTIGRGAKVELAHPPVASGGADAFRFAQYSRYRTERVELAFEREGHRYAVFQFDESGRARNGVRVTDPSGREREIACAGRSVTALQRLKGAVPCDTDSALNLGGCN